MSKPPAAASLVPLLAVIGRAARLELVSPRNLAAEIADAIVRAAAEGRFSLGERLYESELARELGVSRIPVREALRLLTGQGIVVATPSRGIRLMTVDRAQLCDILAVRANLESLAVRQTRESADVTRFETMERALDDMGSAARQKDAYRLVASDIEFHRSLCRVSRNETLLSFWETLATKLRIVFGIALRDKDFDRYYRNHKRLFETIRNEEITAAEQAIQSHILEGRQWSPLHLDERQAIASS